MHEQEEQSFKQQESSYEAYRIKRYKSCYKMLTSKKDRFHWPNQLLNEVL